MAVGGSREQYISGRGFNEDDEFEMISLKLLPLCRVFPCCFSVLSLYGGALVLH